MTYLFTHIQNTCTTSPLLLLYVYVGLLFLKAVFFILKNKKNKENINNMFDFFFCYEKHKE